MIIYNRVDGFQSIDITYYLTESKTVVSHLSYNIKKPLLTLVKVLKDYAIINVRIHHQPALMLSVVTSVITSTIHSTIGITIA